MPDAPAATRWTPQQKLAIETTGQNLLVSAAAGSGKTSVLAERCAYLICDAPPAERCNVNELLVVTFTVAAAQEMRSRIATALHKRYQQTQDDREAQPESSVRGRRHRVTSASARRGRWDGTAA